MTEVPDVDELVGLESSRKAGLILASIFAVFVGFAGAVAH